jgi:hypothetical protein
MSETNENRPQNSDPRAPIPVDGFFGDPRRVLGHPANPTANMTQAFAKYKHESQTPVALTPDQAGLLAEGDPRSSEVLALMDQSGLHFGGEAAVSIDGIQRVISTQPHDLGTRVQHPQ